MGIPGADMHKIQSDKTRGSSVMSNPIEYDSSPSNEIFTLKSNLIQNQNIFLNAKNSHPEN